MTHSNRVWSASRRAPSARGTLSLGLLLSLPVAAAAQGRVAVSTTDDVPATAGLPFAVTDGDLVSVAEGQAVAPFFAGGHFQAVCGFIPTDIDAFAFRPGSREGNAASLVFSLLSNEGGFLDGDVIAVIEGGGATLLASELDIANALGVPGANVDVDALAYDDQGQILFSLMADLAGTALGTVLDGDILLLQPGFFGVSLVLGEADVQTRFTQATGLADAILDVQALEWGGGELWVAVQSPSRHDGSVVSMNGIPRVVYDENNLGLAGTEVDALAELRPNDEIPVFHMSKETALPGDVLHVEVRGRPGAVEVVFMAGRFGFMPFPRMPGFGGLYLDRFDPWLVALRSTHSLPFVTLDGAGTYAVDWALPTGTEFGVGFGGELGWSFQLVELFPMRMSAPFRVQKL